MTSKADPPPDYVETNDVTLSESSAKYQSPDKVIVKTETNRDLGKKLKCYKICLAILAVLVVLLLVIVAILAWRVAVKEEKDDHPETNDRQTNNDALTDLPVYDCGDVKTQGNTYSGVYQVTIADRDVRPTGGKINVYCDMTTDGGAWTVLMRRQLIPAWLGLGQVNFDQSWSKYKDGFGRVDDEFWLGNDLMNELTSNGRQYELRFDMMNYNESVRYAVYESFSVSSEADKYQLKVQAYSGTAGDSLSRHNGSRFSTHDQDNDDKPTQKCSLNHGGWWYTDCFSAKLTGLSGEGKEWQGIIWRGFGEKENLKYAEMKIRQKK